MLLCTNARKLLAECNGNKQLFNLISFQFCTVCDLKNLSASKTNKCEGITIIHCSKCENVFQRSYNQILRLIDILACSNLAYNHIRNEG